MGAVSVAAVAGATPAMSAASDDWAHYLELPPLRGGPGNVWERWTEAGLAIAAEADVLLEELETNVREAATDDPRVAEALTRLAASLAPFQLHEGEFVELPRHRGPESAVDLAPIRRLVRFQAARVHWLRHRGEREAAVQAAVMLLRNSVALLQGGGDIPAFLQVLAISKVGHDTVLWLAKQSDLDPRELGALRAALLESPADPIEAFRNAARAEYELVFREIVLRLPQTNDLDELLAAISVLGNPGADQQPLARPLGPSPVALLVVDQTLREYGEPLAAFLRSLGPDWREGAWSTPYLQRSRAWQAQAPVLADHLVRYEGGPMVDGAREAILADVQRLENPLGRMLIVMLTPAYEAIARQAYRHLAEVRLTQAAVKQKPPAAW